MTTEERAGALIAGVIGLVVFAVVTDHVQTAPSEADTNNTASAACQDAIVPLLTTPTSASFRGATFSPGGNHDVLVSGKVDSSDDAGKRMISSYTCDVASDGTLIGPPSFVDSSS